MFVWTFCLMKSPPRLDQASDPMSKTTRTVIGAIVLTICIAIVFSLGVMFLSKAREYTRVHRCRNNLRLLGLALHNYHSNYKSLPLAAGGSSGASKYPSRLSRQRDSNRGRLSGFVALLPFLDQQAAWSKLTAHNQGGFPPMGPVPSYDPSQYKLWSLQFDVFLCPSDPAVKRDFGLRSYMMNYGDAVDSVGRLFDESDEDRVLRKAVGRGAFVSHFPIKFRDFVDGRSNTMMLSETMIGVANQYSGATVARGVDGLIEQPIKALDTAIAAQQPYRAGQATWPVGKGSCWPEGSLVMNAFTTVLPPNGPSATLPRDPESGCVSASSYHNSGVNVLMVNAAIRFVSNTIDVGDLTAASVSPLHDNVGDESPYGVWGAMGTRAAVEIVPSEREADFKTYSGF